MNLQQTMALWAGGPGSGPHERGALPRPEQHVTLRRMGIHNMSDLTKHISSFPYRYSTGGGKLMNPQEALQKIIGPASEYVYREFSK